MRTFLALATLVLFVAPASAGTPYCEPEVTLETPVGTYYVDNDPCQPGCILSLWIYEESDGEEGCTKGDTIVL